MGFPTQNINGLCEGKSMLQHLLSVLLSCMTALSTTGCSAAEPTPVAETETITFPSSRDVNYNEQPKQRRSVVRIISGSGVCSATQIAPQIILSAAHCFSQSTKLIVVGNQPAIIDRILQDGNDHALVSLSGITFKDFATIGVPLKEGDSMHYWGNPAIFDMLLRRGYVSGFNGFNTLYDVNGYHGDSGAGIFDKNNQLAGVISYIQGTESFMLMGSYPINFTAKQLEDFGLPPLPILMTGKVIKVALN